ncbi:site-specific integrase [Micromonospora purpureochromogenes]|uniref:hypothetical protein n=1 Tax=Micromonospora purpureochromogenes TaxID=47872 RepID=UPI001E36880B|nr:hypothetical protein [Micromonospora purpureochromogenes]
MHHTRDVEQFLIPHIGQLILGDLTSRQLNVAFTAMASTRNRAGRLQSACTLQHVHTTLRAALTGAVREGLIKDNPARRVELPARPRPQAQVWTEARVAEWEASGERPTIAVWTPTQLGSFLDYVRDDNLFALWWLIALRGLRRGEAAGLRWTDVDLHAGQLSVVRQRTTAGYDVHEGPPKSAASRRSVALDQLEMKSHSVCVRVDSRHVHPRRPVGALRHRVHCGDLFGQGLVDALTLGPLATGVLVVGGPGDLHQLTRTLHVARAGLLRLDERVHVHGSPSRRKPSPGSRSRRPRATADSPAATAPTRPAHHRTTRRTARPRRAQPA